MGLIRGVELLIVLPTVFGTMICMVGWDMELWYDRKNYRSVQNTEVLCIPSNVRIVSANTTLNLQLSVRSM